MKDANLLFEEESYAIKGAIFEVYNTLGSGFLENVYQEALEMELAARGIPYESQKPINIVYKGKTMNQSYKADILCYGKIILELKAEKSLSTANEAQLINYLKATGLHLGFLVNFCSPDKVDIRRRVV